MSHWKKKYQKKENSYFFLKYYKESKKKLFLGILFFLSFWIGFLKIPGLSIVWPNYMMGVLFFWTLYRPHLIPLGFLVILGIMDDILSGSILGQTPLLWIFFYISSLSQRKFLIKRSFKKVWIFFSFTFLGYLGLNWIFMCMFQRCQGLFFIMFIQFLMTVGAYPFVSMFLIQVKKGVSFKVLKEAE